MSMQGLERKSVCMGTIIKEKKKRTERKFSKRDSNVLPNKGCK